MKNKLEKLDKNKYFDYSATYPLDQKLFTDVYMEYKDKGIFANPSSVNASGRNAKLLLESARNIIAETLNCKPNEIIFTSGGSESDNMAIKGVMLKYKPGEAEMITTTIEHSAVLETCKQLERFGYTIHYVKPNNDGFINSRDIEKLINSKTKLISVMSINNELGTQQPVDAIRDIATKHNVLFHSDGVQSVGKVGYPIQTFDMVSFSAHKFGGMKGTGFLYKKESIELEPLICGGGQENGFRAGTENVFGNVLMALCLNRHNYYSLRDDRIGYELWKKQENKTDKKWDLEYYLMGLLTDEFGDDVRINSEGIGVINISFKNVDSNALQFRLDQEGFEVSTASACHSNKDNPEPSYVLREIGVPEEFIHGTLRIGFSEKTTKKQVKRLAHAIIKNVKLLRKF